LALLGISRRLAFRAVRHFAPFSISRSLAFPASNLSLDPGV